MVARAIRSIQNLPAGVPYIPALRESLTSMIFSGLLQSPIQFSSSSNDRQAPFRYSAIIEWADISQSVSVDGLSDVTAAASDIPRFLTDWPSGCDRASSFEKTVWGNKWYFVKGYLGLQNFPIFLNFYPLFTLFFF